MDRLHPWLIALSRYTSIPAAAEDDARDVSAFFPAVGWVTGAAVAASFALASVALPDIVFAPLAAAAASTAVGILFTGARHEDGLRACASTCAAARVAPQTFGTCLLVLALVAKCALLALFASRSPAIVLVVLICAQVWSRLWALAIAGDAGGNVAAGESPAFALPFSNRRGWAVALLWALLTLPLALLAHGFLWFVSAVLMSGIAWLAVRKLRQAGAVSSERIGDAAQQLSELGFYFGGAIALALR